MGSAVSVRIVGVSDRNSSSRAGEIRHIRGLAQMDPDWVIGEIDAFLQVTAQIVRDTRPGIVYLGAITRGHKTASPHRSEKPPTPEPLAARSMCPASWITCAGSPVALRLDLVSLLVVSLLVLELAHGQQAAAGHERGCHRVHRRLPAIRRDHAERPECGDEIDELRAGTSPLRGGTATRAARSGSRW